MSAPGPTTPSSKAKSERLLRKLAPRLRAHQILTDPDLLEPYGVDRSGAPARLPDAVVLAESTKDVAALLELATAFEVPVTPRGAGTGKAGGAIPIWGGVVLSLAPMQRIVDLSLEDLQIRAEPGVITESVMTAAREEGLFYPPDPASFSVSTLGGNIATNAGGPRALKYGVTRQFVLELEVVLPTGAVMRFGRPSLKQATGYAFAQLMAGSEGTLGVITEARMRLLPEPRGLALAAISFPSLQTATQALSALFRAGILPRALELLDDEAVAALEGDPLHAAMPAGSQAMIIFETDAPSQDEAEAQLFDGVSRLMEHGASEAFVAQDRLQQTRIWAPRRALSDKLRATSERKLSEDLTVPRSQLLSLIQGAKAIAKQEGIRIATYGHAGDGNLHTNLLFQTGQEENAQRAIRQLFELTVGLGGTLSGEHGLGCLKRDYLPLEQSPGLIQMGRQLKHLWDPKGILNPGKLFPS